MSPGDQTGALGQCAERKLCSQLLLPPASDLGQDPRSDGCLMNFSGSREDSIRATATSVGSDCPGYYLTRPVAICMTMGESLNFREPECPWAKIIIIIIINIIVIVVTLLVTALFQCPIDGC